MVFRGKTNTQKKLTFFGRDSLEKLQWKSQHPVAFS